MISSGQPALLSAAGILAALLAGCSPQLDNRKNLEASASDSEDSYLLVRCGYNFLGETHYLPVESSLRGAPAKVLSQLKVLSEMIEQASLFPKSSPFSKLDPSSPRPAFYSSRIYQLAIDKRRLTTPEIIEPSRPGTKAELRIRVKDRTLYAPMQGDSGLVDYLRQLALERLLKDMNLPAGPLPWQHLAFADFLGSKTSVPSEGGDQLAQGVLKYLNTSENPEPVVLLILDRLDVFETNQLQPFEHSERISLRILYLTRSALDGSKASLQEIAVLSLEYHGKTELFAKALAAFFSKETNPLLYQRSLRRRDTTAELEFIRQIRENLTMVEYAKDSGWFLGSD